MTAVFVLHRADGAPSSTAFRKQAFGASDPFASHREIAWEGPDAMAAGGSFRRRTGRGELSAHRNPGRHPGRADARSGRGRAAGGRPGQGAVIGAGTALRIVAQSPVLLTFCAAACAQPTKRGVFELRADADFKPSATLPAEALLGPRRNAAATTCSPTTAPGTARAPGIRRRITGSSGRIARTSSCSCWTAASGSRRPTAACSRSVPAMHCSCRAARRSGGKAASAWRSST